MRIHRLLIDCFSKLHLFPDAMHLLSMKIIFIMNVLEFVIIYLLYYVYLYHYIFTLVSLFFFGLQDLGNLKDWCNDEANNGCKVFLAHIYPVHFSENIHPPAVLGFVECSAPQLLSFKTLVWRCLRHDTVRA